MSRKRKRRDCQIHENQDRWVVSYADFITLLFAFFVVMYAISSVNEGKYKVLSNVMTSAFSEKKGRSVMALNVTDVTRSFRPFDTPFDGDISPLEWDYSKRPEQENDADEALVLSEKEAQQLKLIANDLKNVTSDLVEQGLVGVRNTKYWVEVDMKSSLLFGSGSAALAKNAVTALTKIANVLKKMPNLVYVEGFTDNVPINTVQFPSNWELSAARAASVVHQLTKLGVDPQRMAAIGFSQYRPINANLTLKGRNMNRRVVLVILAKSRVRDVLSFHDAYQAPGNKQ